MTQITTMFFIWSDYLHLSSKTSSTKSAKNRLIFKDTLKFQIGISLTFLDGLHRNFAWWLTLTSFIFLFFSCIINSQYFFCFWQFFKFLIRHLGKKWVKPEVGLKCIYFLNNNVSSYVWVKFGINRSTCTIWLFLCTNLPYQYQWCFSHWLDRRSASSPNLLLYFIVLKRLLKFTHEHKQSCFRLVLETSLIVLGENSQS